MSEDVTGYRTLDLSNWRFAADDDDITVVAIATETLLGDDGTPVSHSWRIEVPIAELLQIEARRGDPRRPTEENQ